MTTRVRRPERAAARPDHPSLVVAALCLGGLVAALTQTMVIPIQAELPRLLGATVADAAWVITITLLAGAVTMPISGRLADIHGKQRVLLGSGLLLVAGSVISALSSGLAPLLVGRGLQGVAMGFIPVGIALLREVMPPEKVSGAVATMSATLGVGGAIGLPLSAWIAQSGDWHNLFWVSTGAAALVVAAVAMLVPNTPPAQRARLDVRGAVGLALGLSLFLVGISKASGWGWTSGRTLGAIIVGLLVLVGWGAMQLRTREPLVDLRSTARTPVLLTNIAAVAVGMGMMAQAIVMPQLLELPAATGYGLDQSILAAGLWMAPGGLMMLVFAPVASRIIDSRGAKTALALGAAVLGIGYLVAFVLMSAPWQIMVATLVISAGVGIGYAAMPTLVLDASPAQEAGSAVGVNTLMRSLGTAVASAVMGTLLSSSTQPLGPVRVPTEGAFEACFAFGAIASFVAVAVTLTIPRAGRGERPAAERSRSAAAPVASGGARPQTA